jgi:glucosyl-3-phosphoglycerate synthase
MRSLAFLAFGSRLIFHDSDLENYDTATVGRLAAALTADEGLMFVNGASPRLTGTGQPGGRTTEMLRSLYAKQLAGYVPAITTTVQPLIGEFALDADVFGALAFSRGYGVETSLKVLALDLLAPAEYAQVELPIKYQVGQHYHDLVKQFHEISFTVDVLEAFFQRRQTDPLVTVGELADDYGLLFPGRQYALRRPPGYDQTDFVPRLGFYPPLANVPAYQARRAEITAARHAALDNLSRTMRTSA